LVSAIFLPVEYRLIINLKRQQYLLILCVAVIVLLVGCSGPTDADGDGLNKSIEKQHDIDDTLVDSDGDGLNDSRDLHDSSLDPSTNDTDSDGLLDAKELEIGTKPDVADTDGDRAKDGTEVEVDSDPTVKDSDGDGVNDGDELDAGTSPITVDTDQGGLTDSVELENPRLDATSADTDGDGLTDKEEQEYDTNPSQEDTDQDGRDDALEVNSETSPTNADTDGDGLSDGVEAPPGNETAFDPVKADTDSDGVRDDVEKQIGTDPSKSDTDGDGRSDLEEYRTDGVSPTETDVTVIERSPDAGLNGSLTNTTLRSVEFLAQLPESKTQRAAVVNQTATTICDSHNEVMAGTANNVSGISSDTYRSTYRVAHTAKVLHHELGADVNPNVIQQRMETARRVSGVAAKYAPVIGSYQRLHDASCAMKADEPGAREDFYIASAAFTADLALAQQQVMYKAAFKTTGYAAQKVGLMRLARTCGYKCVGLVQSEMYWVTHATYSGALDQAAIEATEGNLTTDDWNESTREDIGEYLETTTNTTQVDGRLISNTKVMDCINENLDKDSFLRLPGNLSTEAVDALRTLLTEQQIPENTDLSFVENVDSVNNCVQS